MFARSARALARSIATTPTASTTCVQCLRAQRMQVPAMRTAQSSFVRYASNGAYGNGHSSSKPAEYVYGSTQSQARRKAIAQSHKPPKRRLEAASQPLRNIASVTRGPVLQCISHTTAERYDLVNLGLVLRELGVRWDEVPEGDKERAFVIGPWKGRGGAERLIRGKDVRRVNSINSAAANGVAETEDDDDLHDMGFGYGERGEVWVFNSGSFVTWGLTEEEGRAFLREVIRRPRAGVEIDRLAPREYEVEEMDFVVDPDDKTNILGNLILLGSPPELNSFPHSPSLASLLARYTLSLSLTRSSSLSVLEGKLDKHIASVSTIPKTLERSGAQPLGRKEVIRKLGELMTLRMAVNTRGGGLEDTPEIYWSEPELESYFDSIAQEFEIKERIDTFNRKIDYASEVQSTLRALLTEASGHRMELIIILLIAVEVVIVLIREGPELGHKLLLPIINYTQALIGVESDGRSAHQVIEDQGEGMVEALESLPHLGLLSSPPRYERDENQQSRLV